MLIGESSPWILLTLAPSGVQVVAVAPIRASTVAAEAACAGARSSNRCAIAGVPVSSEAA